MFSFSFISGVVRLDDIFGVTLIDEVECDKEERKGEVFQHPGMVK